MALDEVERRLCEWIRTREERLRTDLAGHVAIPTGKGHVPGLAQYRGELSERLAKLGAEVVERPGARRPDWLAPPGDTVAEAESDAVEPVVLASRLVESPSPRVLIVGHLDTGHDPHGSFQKLKVVKEGQTAKGPGAADMKGGVLVALAALEALAEADVSLSWTVLLNSDEETGSFESDGILRAAAADHDVGLVVEPALAHGSLATERMGSGQFKIEVFGRASHVGRAYDKGISAVRKLEALVLQLFDMTAPKRGMIVNVGPLTGGLVTNAVADYAACWGNARYADPRTGHLLAEMIDALATSPDATPRVVVHRGWNRPAKPETAAVRALAEAARGAAEDLGQELPFVSTGSVCDGNILQAAGLPTLDTLGVRGGNLHRPDEFIELASLVERSQLLAVLLHRLASARVEVPRQAEAAGLSEAPAPHTHARRLTDTEEGGPGADRLG